MRIDKRVFEKYINAQLEKRIKGYISSGRKFEHSPKMIKLVISTEK